MAKSKTKAEDLLGIHDSDQNQSDDEDQVQDSRFSISNLRSSGFQDESDQDDVSDQDDSDLGSSEDDQDASDLGEDEEEDEEANDHPLQEQKKTSKKTSKVKPMTEKELQELELANKNSGVCYLSRIPRFMTPKGVRHNLSKFADLGKLYLVPEDAKVTARRRKYARNRRINYVEGWVEFKDKKKARALAEHLNMKQVGGKRGSKHYHEMWNIKYLPKFKWRHLTEQFAYERRARQERMRAEMAQAARENKAYIENVNQAKKMANIESKKRKRGEQPDDTGKKKRLFEQREKVDREGSRKKDHLDTIQDNGLKSLLGQVFGK
ncbi:hypothetical protein DM01DRAFT_1228887 [Hesseltinella vesiculosa]|uniref:18S rRNA factor 2 n=1 Tax=Hesseltinella vesiculosa TaxID=101127 RepID=A0A1X2GN33_9FUNG|nr:hypothetical protein DM01DRAFT_1228887 [Hesseltinella vesiculosa]